MVKYLNFVINKMAVNIFAEILHASRAAIDMKHIKWDFSLNAWVQSSRVNIGCGTKAKISLFSEYGHVPYQIKAEEGCSNMVANSLPTDTPLTLGWGQKVKPYFFLKVVILLFKVKQIELRAPRKQVCCHNTFPRPLGWDQKILLFFSF